MTRCSPEPPGYRRPRGVCSRRLRSSREPPSCGCSRSWVGRTSASSTIASPPACSTLSARTSRSGTSSRGSRSRTRSRRVAGSRFTVRRWRRSPSAAATSPPSPTMPKRRLTATRCCAGRRARPSRRRPPAPTARRPRTTDGRCGSPTALRPSSAPTCSRRSADECYVTAQFETAIDALTGRAHVPAGPGRSPRRGKRAAAHSLACCSSPATPRRQNRSPARRWSSWRRSLPGMSLRWPTTPSRSAGWSSKTLMRRSPGARAPSRSPASSATPRPRSTPSRTSGRRSSRPSGRRRQTLERALALATQSGLEEYVGRAFLLLVHVALYKRDYGVVRRYLATGLEYCSARGLDTWRLYLEASRARLRARPGRVGRGGRRGDVGPARPAQRAGRAQLGAGDARCSSARGVAIRRSTIRSMRRTSSCIARASSIGSDTWPRRGPRRHG